MPITSKTPPLHSGMIVDAWGRVGEGGGVISRKVGAVNPPRSRAAASATRPISPALGSVSASAERLARAVHATATSVRAPLSLHRTAYLLYRCRPGGGEISITQRLGDILEGSDRIHPCDLTAISHARDADVSPAAVGAKRARTLACATPCTAIVFAGVPVSQTHLCALRAPVVSS